MQSTSEQDRQFLGCGYLVPDKYWGISAWDGQQLGRKPSPFEKGIPNACAGYVTDLNEVNETTYAHNFKKDGELTQFCEGGTLTPAQRDAVLVLEGEIARFEEWRMENPPPKKG